MKNYYILKIDMRLSFLEKVAVLSLGKGKLYVLRQYFLMPSSVESGQQVKK